MRSPAVLVEVAAMYILAMPLQMKTLGENSGEDAPSALLTSSTLATPPAPQRIENHKGVHSALTSGCRRPCSCTHPHIDLPQHKSECHLLRIHQHSVLRPVRSTQRARIPAPGKNPRFNLPAPTTLHPGLVTSPPDRRHVMDELYGRAHVLAHQNAIVPDQAPGDACGARKPPIEQNKVKSNASNSY